MSRPLRSARITRASALLRAGPPARAATVLSTSPLPAAWCAPSRARSLAGAVSARAFPCFRTQAADRARATCTPGTTWPAIRAFRQAHPGTGIIAPVPMPFHPLDASAVVHSRSPSRSPPDGSHAAFSASLSTTVFSQGTMRWLDASPRRAAPKGHETFILRAASTSKSSPPTAATPFRAHGAKCHGLKAEVS